MSSSKYKALYSTIGISFWGGIDPLTGNVIDQSHPLHNQNISNKIVVIPSGRGSCTGSQVMLELILNKKAPRAIILRDVDSILCTGAVIAEEFFGEDIEHGDVPIICAVGEEQFAKLIGDGYDYLSIKTLDDEISKGDVCIHSENDEIYTKDLLKLRDTLESDAMQSDQTTSPAEELALHTVKRIASISGATELIPITSAHIDAVTYIGQGGLRFAQKLVELGGKVKVK